MTVPKKCPICGVEGTLKQDEKYTSCKDCGAAWPNKAYKAKLGETPKKDKK